MVETAVAATTGGLDRKSATVVGPSFLVLDHQLEPLQELKLTSYDAPPEAWTASVDTEGACDQSGLFVKRLLPEQIVPPVFHSQHYRVHLLLVRGIV